MSETLSEQVLRVIADFEWIGTQRRLGEMWAMDFATLEAERDKLQAKLEAMEKLMGEEYVQWGWNGLLPMEFGFCYLCGSSHIEGHLTTCDFAILAAAQEE